MVAVLKDVDWTPAHAAKLALEQAKGNRAKAAQILTKWIEQEIAKLKGADKTLFVRMMKPYLDRAIDALLNHQACDYRRRILKENGLPSSSYESPEQSIHAGDEQKSDRKISFPPKNIEEKWQMFQYPFNRDKIIADAKPDELREFARRARKSGRTNLVNAKWCELLADGIKGDARVKDTYSNDDMAKLRHRAESEVKTEDELK